MAETMISSPEQATGHSVYEPNADTILYAIFCAVSTQYALADPFTIAGALAVLSGGMVLFDLSRIYRWYTVTKNGFETDRLRALGGYRRDGKVYVKYPSTITILGRHYANWRVEDMGVQVVKSLDDVPQHAIPINLMRADDQLARLQQLGDVSFLIRCWKEDKGDVFLIADDHARSLYLLDPID